jgi:hypothetical protein
MRIVRVRKPDFLLCRQACFSGEDSHKQDPIAGYKD